MQSVRPGESVVCLLGIGDCEQGKLKCHGVIYGAHRGNWMLRKQGRNEGRTWLSGSKK